MFNIFNGIGISLHRSLLSPIATFMFLHIISLYTTRLYNVCIYGTCQINWIQHVINNLYIDELFILVLCATFLFNLAKQSRIIQTHSPIIQPCQQNSHPVTNQYDTERLAYQNLYLETGKITHAVLHDLRQPLHLLTYNLHEINEHCQILPRIKRKHFQHSVRNAISGSKTIEQLLLIPTNYLKKNPQKTLFSPALEIQRILNLYSFIFKKENIHYQLNLDTSIRLYGCKPRFSQILLNLISNALDSLFSSYGSQRLIHITLKKYRHGIDLWFYDNGAPIPNQTLPYIFDQFYTTKSHGTGLGLPIIKTIVEQDFQGHITVQNAQSGKTFLLHFHRRQPQIA